MAKKVKFKARMVITGHFISDITEYNSPDLTLANLLDIETEELSIQGADYFDAEGCVEKDTECEITAIEVVEHED